ncbi:zinc finger CCHC domain-containing protein 14 [Brachyhypopomus gauderio]|uniref:zinc finger CCHC domain-containing protein 14 n=1 Tax=Brachyhypopomus gauderio TaxID=698409 RepID=UPI004042DF0C
MSYGVTVQSTISPSSRSSARVVSDVVDMVEHRGSLQRDGVYRWFSVLNSAQRTEFLCGLLDLCVPIELRFLGSCLEDLARKDYHSLRDAEIKANNPADLANLTNITDEVVRSKLLISLALLSSENRVAAGVLFRTLTHIDSIIKNYGLQLNDGETEEQFLLLFTMASNHPAFSFHQKQVLRQQLTQIQEILQVTGSESSYRGGGGTGSPAALTVATTIPSCISACAHLSCRGGCPCCTKTIQREAVVGLEDEGLLPEVMTPTPTPSSLEPPVKAHSGTSEKVWVERIEVKGITQKADSSVEYTLEVLWSDATLSTLGKTSQEVVELITQLSQLFPDDCLEKFLPQPGVDELGPRCLAALPTHVLKHDRVRLFLRSQLPAPPTPSSVLQYRGVSRAICGVASIQPVVNVHASIVQTPPPHLPQLPLHTSPAGTLGESSLSQGYSNPTSLPQPQHTPTQPPGPTQPNPEQNGILDWLRKLRLHKYYPVFKQLTMEEFLALTEEDLNKYDLTQGAKKKLKTQLELQKEKLEKRFLMSRCSVSCAGVARVTPSSYNGPLTHTHSELQVEVEASSLPALRDSSSSSGYSSAPCSPMLVQSRDASFDRTREPPRRVESGVESGEKERPCFLGAGGSAGPSRPTAQVLPVQNDPSLSPSHVLSAGRGLHSPRKLRPPPLCPEDRPKPQGAGVGVGVRFESLFPGVGVEGVPPVQQEGPGARCPLTALRSPPALLVETSTALTVTSNTLHHFSHPPLHLQVSPSPTHPMGGHYTHPASSSSSSSLNSKPAFPPVSAIPMVSASGVPMAAVSGNTYSANMAAPSSSSISAEAYSLAQANVAGTAVCVCTSCGCSGNCGSYSTLPSSYSGYVPHPFSATSVFTLGPLVHLGPLLTGTGSASPFSYPLVAPPLYSSSLSPDSQQNLVLPPMQGYLGGGANAYQPHGLMGNGVSGQKKAGNMSCYNCGVSGHRALDCKQPPMDSTQQGMFRLKYSPQSDSQDSGD